VAADRPPLPVPGLDGRRLTDEEFDRLLPEKLEYYGDYKGTGPKLCGPRGGPALLALLLANFGLREVVRFAPRELWQQALDELP
jgi:hypothetical protein